MSTVLKSLTDSTALKNAVKVSVGDFSGGPMVKNPPLNAGDMALVLGWGTRSPHAMGRLTPHATVTNEPMLQQRFCMSQLRPDAVKNICFFKGQCG